MSDIVIDFDGTVVTHNYPNMGVDIGAVPVLKQLVAKGHRLVLSTMRGTHGPYGDTLKPAVKWFADNGIDLYGVQENPSQHTWTNSPKAYGQLIIDDAALGCPLKMDHSLSDAPFVNWDVVNQHLVMGGFLGP